MGYDISYDDLVGWEADLGLLTEQVAGSLFTRPEPRATFADLVRGLLADVPRKNSWQLAEHVGHGSAYRLEWLLGGAKWDADALRDRVRDYVVATLGAEDGVLIADDTQVIKKGVKSVGVAPQHCGVTGQTENCQVLPMLAYASWRGHAFIDRALYLPRRWTDDPQRCAQAGVPAERGFATKYYSRGFPVRGRAVAQRDTWSPGCGYIALRSFSVGWLPGPGAGDEPGAVVVPAGGGLVASSA